MRGRHCPLDDRDDELLHGNQNKIRAELKCSDEEDPGRRERPSRVPIWTTCRHVHHCS